MYRAVHCTAVLVLVLEYRTTVVAVVSLHHTVISTGRQEIFTAETMQLAPPEELWATAGSQCSCVLSSL